MTGDGGLSAWHAKLHVVAKFGLLVAVLYSKI